MNFNISGVIGALSNYASQLDSCVKTIPVAGPVYTAFAQHIGRPLWNLGGKVKDTAAPYLNQARQWIEPTIRKHSLIAGIAAVTLACFTFKAMFLYDKNVGKDNPKDP